MYKKHHQKICLKRRLQAGEISELDYLERKGLLKMPKPEKAPGDPNQNTLWLWQWSEENQAMNHKALTFPKPIEKREEN